LQIRPTAPRFRPRLEALEDRWLLSTLAVTNNLDSGPGSLRAEIAAAQNNDTIVFAPSLAGQTITLTSGELFITTGVTIQGPGAGQLTVSGNNHQFRVFEVNATQPVALTGLTISNGDNGILNHSTLMLSSCTIAGNYWGGISNSGTLTVSGSTISGNSTGISNSGTITVSGSTISGNLGGGGGGIFNGGTMTVSGCNITGNRANFAGGGVYNSGSGTLTVSDSTIARNSCNYRGGGLFALGKVTLTNCTLNNNSGGYFRDGYGGQDGGGGVYAASGSTVTLTNCTLTNNVGWTLGGGGLFVSVRATVNLTNCTVSGNSADFNSGGDPWGPPPGGYGGGIYVSSFMGVGILNLTNTIVAGNTAVGRGPDIYAYPPAVVNADHCLVGDYAGNWLANGVNGNIVGPNYGRGNPLLGPLQNNGGPTQTMALLPGSPAIGHGNNAKAPAKDQRGVTRLDVPGEMTDIGAFEV